MHRSNLYVLDRKLTSKKCTITYTKLQATLYNLNTDWLIVQVVVTIFSTGHIINSLAVNRNDKSMHFPDA